MEAIVPSQKKMIDRGIAYFVTDTTITARFKGRQAFLNGTPRHFPPRIYRLALRQQWRAGWDEQALESGPLRRLP